MAQAKTLKSGSFVIAIQNKTHDKSVDDETAEAA